MLRSRFAEIPCPRFTDVGSHHQHKQEPYLTIRTRVLYSLLMAGRPDPNRMLAAAIIGEARRLALQTGSIGEAHQLIRDLAAGTIRPHLARGRPRGRLLVSLGPPRASRGATDSRPVDHLRAG